MRFFGPSKDISTEILAPLGIDAIVQFCRVPAAIGLAFALSFSVFSDIFYLIPAFRINGKSSFQKHLPTYIYSTS